MTRKSEDTEYRPMVKLAKQFSDLPKDWNWLAEEYPVNEDAKLVHYTLGVPAMKAYAESQHAKEWFEAFYGTQYIDT